MGIDVEIWNESRLMGWDNGESRRVQLEGPFEFPLQEAIEADEHLELIKHIDPYGETVFNGHQMPTLIEDFELLSKYVDHPSEQRALDEIIRAARVCEREVHHYLVFIGD